MKKLIMLTAVLLAANFSNAQLENKSCPIKKTQISKKQVVSPGLYYITKEANGTLLLRKTPSNKMGYGAKIRIELDHTLVDSYTAPCGNDTKIHRTTGAWKTKTDGNGNRIFTSDIDINYSGRNFYLISLRDHLELIPIKKSNKQIPVIKRMPSKIQKVQSGRI